MARNPIAKKKAAPKSAPRSKGLHDHLPSSARREQRASGSLDWAELLRRNCIWIMIAALAVFLGYRVIHPRHVAAEVIAHEQRVVRLLRAIHNAQLVAYQSETGGARSLGDLVQGRGGDPLPPDDLRGFALETQRGVELLRGEGYLIALYRAYLPDSARKNDRTWASTPGDAFAGAAGYGAYAWPEEYSADSQWAFHVDHRGQLLGGWNHSGLLNGLSDPFPPAVNPLREYQTAVRSGDTGEWVLFDGAGTLTPIVLRDENAEDPK